jgi:hypothetical protein
MRRLNARLTSSSFSVFHVDVLTHCVSIRSTHAIPIAGTKVFFSGFIYGVRLRAARRGEIVSTVPCSGPELGRELCGRRSGLLSMFKFVSMNQWVECEAQACQLWLGGCSIGERSRVSGRMQ